MLEPIIEREHWLWQVLCALVMGAMLVGFWFFTQQYWVAAHAGADQNGYLVGGRMLAGQLTTAQRVGDPYEFAGRMWVAAGDGRFVPKYPPGVCLLVAIVLKIGGAHAVYFISPICMMLGLIAVFLIARRIGGSVAAILGMAMVASSPITLALANNPNSHAIDFCLANFGIFCLIRWWERGAWWRAAAAGMLLGLAVTVRYSEAVLLLPMLLVALFNLRWRRGGSYLQVGALVLGWTVPVSIMLLSNHLAMDRWTGYDATNESGAAFSLEHFQNHWELMLRQLAGVGMFLIFPIGILGMVLLLGGAWKVSLLLWLWLVPSVLLYSAYYWYLPADSLTVGSQRFLLTILPPIAIGAACCMTSLAPRGNHSARAFKCVILPVAGVLVVGGAGVFNVCSAIPMLENEARKCRAAAMAAEQVIEQAKAPSGSVVFGPEEILNHLQFVADYRLYSTSELDPAYVLTLRKVAADQPNALEPLRAKKLYDLLAGGRDEKTFKTEVAEDIGRLYRKLAIAAMEQKRRVFVIAPKEGGLVERFIAGKQAEEDKTALAALKVTGWTEPVIAASGITRANSAAGSLPAASWQLVEITRAK